MTDKATDWNGHTWRERVFCCIALLNMEGFLTPVEHGRIVRRAERKLNGAVVRGKPFYPDVGVTLQRSDDNVRWRVDVPRMFLKQAD